MRADEPKVEFNARLMAEDMAALGWLKKDLARRAGTSAMAVTRFLRGDHQTPRIAKKLARALGYSVERYLIRAKAIA